MSSMKFLSSIVTVITVLSVNCGNLSHGYEVIDSTDGVVIGVYSEDQAKLMNEVYVDRAAEDQILIFPDGDEQLNEEENGSNAGELESSQNTTTSKPSGSCEMNGGECMSKKNKKNCQGTINTEYSCSNKDVCCMPDVLGLLLQSIKENQKSIKDDLSELKSNISDIGTITETKLNNVKGSLDVLMSNLTNLNNNQDLMKSGLMSNLTNLKSNQDMMKNNQDVVMSNLTNLGSTHCPKGFFLSSGHSRQCFKYFNDTTRSWTSAVSKCQAEGLVLAEPYDPVAVRAYIVTKYGGSQWTWINGRGTGSYMKLQRSGAYVYSGNAYWWNGHPSSYVSTSYCLMFTTNYSWMKSYPIQTYYTWSCTNRAY
ncbi:unnamed protein product, partial [Meganyctiphanes norvegica]